MSRPSPRRATESATERAATELTRATLRAFPLPSAEQAKGKDARGRVLVIGGSDETPGAVRLAGEAALRAGAGKLMIGTTRGAALPLAIALPEARVRGLASTPGGQLAARFVSDLDEEVGKHDALLVGPGLFEARGVEALLARRKLFADGLSLVVDAGAIDAFAKPRRRAHLSADKLLLTPNPGEMASLTGLSRERIEADPLPVAREVARELGAVIALRDAQTYVVAPSGEAFVFRGGDVGLGTSGSGDVLAGIAVGLAARGADALTAALWSVLLHGSAGSRLARSIGKIGFLARELLPVIPGELARLCR